MIRLSCTHCRQILTIDDGFAGGVCRCQHCGTIQTVPATPGKSKQRGAAPAKTLYRASPRTSDESHHGAGSGSGLDELAQIVSSSGLGSHSHRLRQKPGDSGAGLPPAPRKTRLPLFALIAGGLIILILLAVIFLLTRRLLNSQPPPPITAASAPPAVQPPAGPTFAGLPLQAQDTVVYLLDDGGSAGDFLPAMLSATYDSIRSLGPNRRFKVICWRQGSLIYPPDGTAHTSPQELAKCQAAFQDAYAQGNTQIDDALKSAIAVQPDAIVVVTAKAAQLPDDFVTSVLAITVGAHPRIYTIGINGDSTSSPSKPGVLATLAAQTSGRFLNISSTDLTHR